MKKSLLATFLLVLGGLWLSSSEGPSLTFDAFFSFLSAAQRAQLSAQNELTSVAGSGAPTLRSTWIENEVQRSLSVARPTLVAEGWFVFPRPAGITVLSLYNAVNNISSMEGLEYFSVSQKKRQPLILASYRIVRPDATTKMPDPVFSVVPETQRAFVFQRDNRLGDGASELIWRAPAGAPLTLTMRNLEPLKTAFVTLVEPGNLQMLFVLQPLDDRIAVYGLVEAQTVSFFGLEKSKEESYRNRMRALADWVGTRIASLR